MDRSLGRLTVGVVIGWLVLDRTAALTHSNFGEHGILGGVVTLTVVVALQIALHRRSFPDAVRGIGLRRPRGWGLVPALVLSAAMLAGLPVFSWATGIPLRLREGWPSLVPGLLAQGGIAEEVVFRGYLFGHLRESRTFWRAAVMSVPPFLVVHLLLFASLAPPLAAAATLLAATISFPLAWLYELGNASIWGPALLHAVIQGGIKIVVAPDAAQTHLAGTWMGLSMLTPWLVFGFARDPKHSGAQRNELP